MLPGQLALGIFARRLVALDGCLQDFFFVVEVLDIGYFCRGPWFYDTEESGYDADGCDEACDTDRKEDNAVKLCRQALLSIGEAVDQNSEVGRQEQEHAIAELFANSADAAQSFPVLVEQEVVFGFFVVTHYPQYSTLGEFLRSILV